MPWNVAELQLCGWEGQGQSRGERWGGPQRSPRALVVTVILKAQESCSQICVLEGRDGGLE